MTSRKTDKQADQGGVYSPCELAGTPVDSSVRNPTYPKQNDKRECINLNRCKFQCGTGLKVQHEVGMKASSQETLSLSVSLSGEFYCFFSSQPHSPFIHHGKDSHQQFSSFFSCAFSEEKLILLPFFPVKILIGQAWVTRVSITMY